MKFYVDRIEKDVVICENDNNDIASLPLSDMPDGIKDGSVLLYEGGKYTLLTDEEEERRNRMLSLQNEIFLS